MVVVVPPPPALSPDVLSLFSVADELLSSSPILIFYGPSATTTVSSSAASRIQTHVYSPAGFQSFPRLTISPSSPLYAAVNCLALEEQGDEICRGLAFSLYKYFSEIPANVKEAWNKNYNSLGKLPSAPKLFGEAHAALLASRMVKVENVADVIKDIQQALAEQTLSWLDLDVVLPPGAMKPLDSNRPRDSTIFEDENDVAMQQYGQYAPIVRLFGEPAFIPTSKLRRAPSKPTALNRSASFARKQKESLRREMVEFLDTEESYVSKVYDLVHGVAEDFREKAKNKHVSSTSPSEKALQRLFPPSLDQILATNNQFLEALRHVLEETEEGAILDIESTPDDGIAQRGSGSSKDDVTGTLAFARCLVSWFPKFSDCYADYMQAHATFPQSLRTFMNDTGSSFSRRVQDTGEQRLMSMLIEPVQRLPRYSLYIDNIVKQLPARHPALKPLLKARDIISEICSREAHSSHEDRVVDHLQRLMSTTWSRNLRPNTRLITAIDVVELTAPYRVDNAKDSMNGILLLFANYLIIIHKHSESSVTARSLQNEVEDLRLLGFVEDNDHLAGGLTCEAAIPLSDLAMTEVGKGGKIQIAQPHKSLDATEAQAKSKLRVFNLTGTYQGKASRFMEEVVKARVEGRFSETEREGHKWDVRSASGDLSLFSAVFEAGAVEGRRAPAKVRIAIDPFKGSGTLKAGDEGIEVAVSLATVAGGMYRLEIHTTDDQATADQITASEFLPVLNKRLGNLLQLRNQIRYSPITTLMLRRNTSILKSLNTKAEAVEKDLDNERTTSRPHSPVKMLTSLFGSVSKETGNVRRPLRAPPSLGNIPRMPPPTAVPKPPSREGQPLQENDLASAVARPKSADSPVSPLQKYEDCLATYVLALHARKGNTVGSVVRNRSRADVLLVNELYNGLLENPANPQLAGQVSVDVLFAAFEKFIQNAWKEKMGAVITREALDAIQSKADCMYPGDFEEYFRKILGEMSPQSQRALQALIKLLADLLEGTSNDGDRGILTAAFAEVIVPNGNSFDYILLLDRFIEDVDALFGERPNSSGSYSQSSVSSQNRSFNTGSISSNTSSLRKKFGLSGLTRDNSRSEHDSKASGSVWRTLSKQGRGMESQPSSISRGTVLERSLSTDTDVRLTPKRPVSRDRPTVLGKFEFEGSPVHPSPGFRGLGTIGEAPDTTGPPKKKRRSSLSDVYALQASSAANSPAAWNSQTPSRRPGGGPGHSRQVSASPLTPSPAKRSAIPSPLNSNRQVSRLGSPIRNENTSAQSNVGTPLSPPGNNASEVTITSYSPRKKRPESVATSIPTLKSTQSSGALTERATGGNAVKKLEPSSSPTKKLRMQSPQKLRERLDAEQKAMSNADASLQAELAMIGAEIGSLKSTPRSSRLNAQPASIGRVDAAIPAAAASLATRLSSIESKLTTQVSEANARNAALQADLKTSLQVSESKATKLDQLYREANLENEALYGRFNEELSRVLKAVKSGEGVDELKKALKESQDEAAALKRENWRLKREAVGLRAQLKE